MSLAFDVAEKAVALIRQFGSDAAVEAARRADEMLLEGKLYERRTWRRVEQAISQLVQNELAISEA